MKEKRFNNFWTHVIKKKSVLVILILGIVLSLIINDNKINYRSPLFLLYILGCFAICALLSEVFLVQR